MRRIKLVKHLWRIRTWTYLKNLLVLLRKVDPLIKAVVFVNGNKADVLKNKNG